jgi:hypothetical protein
VEPDGDTGTDDPGQIREEDPRRLIEQLRSTPAERIVEDLFSTLLTAAEVKLGRRDARLFIDLCAVVHEHAGGYVSDQVSKQVETTLGQLRFAQVSAENEMAKKGDAEPNDLARVPTTARQASPSPGDRTSEPQPSRLWVPRH